MDLIGWFVNNRCKFQFIRDQINNRIKKSPFEFNRLPKYNKLEKDMLQKQPANLIADKSKGNRFFRTLSLFVMRSMIVANITNETKC